MTRAVPGVGAAASADPSPREIHALLSEGRLAAAADAIETLARASAPDEPALLVLRARLCAARGDLSEAAECLRRATRSAPADADLHHDLALVLARQGDFDLALHHLRTSLELDPSDVGTHQSLVELLWKLDKHRAALEFLRRATQSLPAPELQVLLARAAALAREPAVAREAVEWLKAHTETSAQRCLDLGSLQLSLGDLDQAELEYREALELAPEEASVHHAVATLFVERGEVGVAELAFRAALERDPSYWPTLNDLGLLLLSLRRGEEAVELLRSAVSLRADEAVSRLNLALALLASGSRPAALQHARAALALAQDDELRAEAACLVRRLAPRS